MSQPLWRLAVGSHCGGIGSGHAALRLAGYVGSGCRQRPSAYRASPYRQREM